MIVVVIFSLGRMLIYSRSQLFSKNWSDPKYVNDFEDEEMPNWKLVSKVFVWTLTDTSISSKLQMLLPISFSVH